MGGEALPQPRSGMEVTKMRRVAAQVWSLELWPLLLSITCDDLQLSPRKTIWSQVVVTTSDSSEGVISSAESATNLFFCILLLPAETWIVKWRLSMVLKMPIRKKWERINPASAYLWLWIWYRSLHTQISNAFVYWSHFLSLRYFDHSQTTRYNWSSPLSNWA